MNGQQTDFQIDGIPDDQLGKLQNTLELIFLENQDVPEWVLILHQTILNHWDAVERAIELADETN